MKSANHKRIFRQISETQVNEVFLAELKNDLANYIGQRPIEKKPAFTWSVNRVAVSATVIILCLTSTGLVYASQSSLPGNALYPVKRATEQVRLAIVVSPKMKKDLEVKFINKRLEEVERLETEPKKNNAVLQEALITVEKEIVKLEKEEAQDETPDTSIAQSTTSTLSVLSETEKFENKETEKPLTISRRNLNKLIKKHRRLEKELPDKASTTQNQKINNELKSNEKMKKLNKEIERSDNRKENREKIKELRLRDASRTTQE